jgi:formate C-acetyltransferase
MVATGTDNKLIEEIDGVVLGERIQRLRERLFETSTQVAKERAQVAVEAWQQSDGRPAEIRRAHLVEQILHRVPVVIHDNERLVGSETPYFQGVHPPVDLDPTIVLDHLKAGKITLSSDAHEAIYTPEDLEVMEETARYFVGKTGADLVRDARQRLWGSWWDDFIEVCGTIPYERHPIVSGALLYENVLAQGLNGFMETARKGLKRLAAGAGDSDQPEKVWFWESVLITCQALIEFAARYARLAQEMAAFESDPKRKKELEETALVCQQVPANPATTFREALQGIRFAHVGVRLEGGWGPSLGRLDQTLYPFFIKDLREGRLTMQEASDLLAELFNYAARDHAMYSLKDAQNGQQSSSIINITLGGVTRDGEDACNELTYLILHLAGLLRFAQPQLTLRLGSSTPKWAVIKSMETNRKIGGGIPQFHNDDHIVEYLAALDVPIEDARDWAANGCSQPFPANFRCYFRPANKINMALALDLALHNGIAPRSGKLVGLETGDPRNFETFDKLYDAFQKQYEFILRRSLEQTRFAHRAEVAIYRMPLLSVMLPGCLENGMDVMMGGQGTHPTWYAKDRAIVDTADSLTAVRTLVFDQKRVTMDRLLEALDSDFKGDRGQEIQVMCLAAPKYGNEDAQADGMLRQLGKASAAIIFTEKNVFGDKHPINRNGVGWHYYGGHGVGALPNGRNKEDALTDGSLSPTQGRDGNGPTAVLNSALAADFKEAAVSILNQRFPITMVASQESLEKVAALTETFIRDGGTHIQYNFLDRQTLVAAKEHPEKYRDLVVRVAGYSAYFIHLAPEVQDEIIRRTEHELA